MIKGKPFVKWAGGKGQLIPQIKKYYPPYLGTKIKKYCEPMVGAGAVLFDILNNFAGEILEVRRKPIRLTWYTRL